MNRLDSVSGPRVRQATARRPVSMRQIQAVVRQIAERFQPEQIILFGSYATGTPGPDSDVDLLVVMETPLSSRQQALEIVRAIDYHFGLDLIVRTPAQMAERLALGDFFLKEIVETGRVLYARPDGCLSDRNWDWR